MIYNFKQTHSNVYAFKKRRILNPYRWLAASFLGLIIIGTLLLVLPCMSTEPTSLVDALFTATSCVSVTGLSTVDTFTHWTLLGKVVMVLLIQIGGIGTMTFSSIILLLLGQRIGLQGQVLLQEDVGQEDFSMSHIVKRIAILVGVIEGIGSLIYIVQLFPYLGISALYYGLFQSISTFCNAGFVFFDNQLPYQMVGDPLFTLNTCGLILLGGFGYMSFYDVIKNYKRGFSAFQLHTKIMITGEIVLVLFGMASIGLIEWNNPATLGPLSIFDKLQASLFQAVTPRTAGIATVDYGAMHPISLFITIVLMFIGAGPNSTAGGIKISTFIIIGALSIAIFKNRRDVEIYKRKIGLDLIYKASTILFFSTGLILLGTFALLWIEGGHFITIAFEVTSAFATVGLTTGLTPDLSTISKLILILIMYTGRIGVITLIGAFALKTGPQHNISYPEETVLL